MARHDLFISFDGKDRVVARRIADLLVARGLNVWFDEWSLGPHEHVDRGVYAGVRDSEWTVALVTSTYCRAWTGAEIGASDQERIIVLRDRDAELPGPLHGRASEPIDVSAEHRWGRALDVVAAVVQGRDYEGCARSGTGGRYLPWPRPS